MDVFQLLLGKLGELTLSMESIVGPSVPFSNIDLGFDDLLPNGFDDLLPDVGSYIQGALEAKNEIFHMCEEVNATGADPPSIEDVIAIIQEDVLGAQEDVLEAQDDIFTTDSRRLRSRSLRALRNHHLPHTRSSRHQRDRALRAHRLPFNHYTRPRNKRSRRLLEEDALEEDASRKVDLLDSLTVEGGFDGSTIYVQLSIDLSMPELHMLSDLLQRPLAALSNVEKLKNVFGQTNDGNSSLTLNTDFSAGAHFSVLVGCDITGSELKDASNLNATGLFKKSFIQVIDASAKFEASAKINGTLNIEDLASLYVEGGSAGLALGVGISEVTSKIYFSEIQSAVQALRQNALWNKVGAIDISLPVNVEIEGLTSLVPIITISDDYLFDSESVDVSIDFKIA